MRGGREEGGRGEHRKEWFGAEENYSVGIGRGTVSRGCMLSGVASLPVRKAGQRCANGYLNQMGVPVLGVGPLVLFWGAREGALSGREGSPSRLGSRRRIIFGPPRAAKAQRGLFFYFLQRLVLFFCFLARGYRFLTLMLFGVG